ncbi:M56 family metallopeptidase [Chryseobacterium sp. C-71]|uniref:M56 family metallopeptidase n=1 Tax=Chryseobacterium sp. C-71 TaxID=2893882 RepID=UPI001E2DE528|nr:M56 family metallopeptidase [Chryseobacterium sp. C-71]UFH32809.1 M56 family metallopeptidase [Chryseobacterium sp. C-71]
METVTYCLKAIVCSGILYAYYLLFLKDKTFHHYNRFYLLLLVVVSLILPLLKIEYFTIEFSNQVFLVINKFQSFTDSKNTNDGINYWEYINFGIIGIAILLLSKLVFGILKIIRFKTQFKKENFEGINFYQTNLSEAPFSYFKNLFWKNTIILNSDLGKQILKHEMVHIEQKHSYDKIFIEIVTAVFWFNPFFYLIKKEINLIHEYLADNKAVKQSDTKAFAQMLLASHFSGNQLPATSPFLSSNLKKRLKMIQKPKTKFGYVRRISALPVLFTVAFAYMVNAKNKEIEKVNHDVEKIVQSLEFKNNPTEVQPNTENVSVEIIRDTIKPPVSEVSNTNTISNLKITSSVENSWGNQLKDAGESDIFLVDGKKVSKDVFIDFFGKNIDTPNYIFSHSTPKNDDIKVMIYSAAKNSDQLSSAVRNKLMKENKVGNDMFLYMTKMISTDQERENLRQSVLEAAKARKAVEEAQDKRGNEVSKNLDFKKGRDYNKNPLNQNEIKELRADAEKLKIKSEKEFEARKDNMIIFKYDAIVSYVKNEDQSITKDDRKDPVKATVMMMPLIDGRFFVDGKEFTKEELKKYMKSFEEDVFRKDIASAKAPFKSVKMYRTPYGDKGFSKLDKVEFSTK